MASDSRRCLIILCSSAGMSWSGIGALAAMSRSCSAAEISRRAESRCFSPAFRAALVSAIRRSRMSEAPVADGDVWPPPSPRKCALTQPQGSPSRGGGEIDVSQDRPKAWADAPLTGRLVLADGTVIAGQGLGATGSAVGEVCFNTAMTGYQEILTDPSYAGQIITFTFPHIGNVGTNRDDTETSNLAMRSGVRGCILRASVTEPSNYRAAEHLDQWLKARVIAALAGIDTRALTARIREQGMPDGVIAHEPSRKFDLEALL